MLEVVSDAPEAIPHLPPRDAWKVDPEKVKKFYAPRDDRGFVLPRATIEEVLKLFDDEYVWPVDWSKNTPQLLRPDDHHFHWIAEWYDKKHFSGKSCDVPRRFRELPSNRGILPRQFHNALHEVTLPPKMPKLGHMEHYLQSFEIAKDLFSTAERALWVESKFLADTNKVTLERLMHRFDDLFTSYRKRSAKALGINALRVIGVDEVDLMTEPFRVVVERLGSCAFQNIPNYTNDYFSSSRVDYTQAA